MIPQPARIWESTMRSFAKPGIMLLLLLSAMLPAADGDQAGIEAFLRALQERYFTVTGQYLRMPGDPAAGDPNQNGPAFPSDGFYANASLEEKQAIISDAITNCGFVVSQFKVAPTPDADFLQMPDVTGMQLDDALRVATTALQQCRYAHFGPGGLQVLPVDGRVRRVDISRATINPPLDVQWFNAGYSRVLAGFYDKEHKVTDDNVYALSLRTVDLLYTGVIQSVAAGFDYGFSITYQLQAWQNTTIQPYYAITWYSALGNAGGSDPIWPEDAMFQPAAHVPFWIPAGTPCADQPDPQPWITPYQGMLTKQLHPVRASDTFAGPTSLPCTEATTIALNMDFDTATIGNTWHPKSTDYSSWFFQIDYRGFMVDLQPCFANPVPAYQPLDVVAVYPGSCPTCVGTIAKDFSVIDNGSMTYYHDAWDYQQGTPSGCATCGGSVGSNASSVALSLGRIHRYRDLDWGASFGPGVLSNHDLRLQVFAEAGGGLSARFFDPLQRTVCELSAATGAVLHDAAAVSRSLTLRDAAASPTADLVQARSAVLELSDGRTLQFDLFPQQPGDPTALAGRIAEVADQQGHRLRYAYVDADPLQAEAGADADVAGRWRFISIRDERGIAASFTWRRAAGQWVIATATMPGGGIFTYTYAETGLVSLQGVAYPTGEASSFTPGWDEGDQWVTLAIDDAGADTTHRHKQVSFTPSIEAGLAGGARPQLPNLVRQVVNGNGEVSYRNWVEVHDAFHDFYNLTGGGSDQAGVLHWVRYRDGLPIWSKVAVHYFPGQPFASHTWIAESDYATDAHMRPTTAQDPDGTFTTYDRDARGNITARIRHRPDGTEISRVTTTWDAFDNPLVVTDELGRVTRNTYTDAGLLATRTVALGTADEATWHYDYDAQGHLIAATDANGNETDSTYDPITGLLTSVKEPADKPGDPRPTRHFTYDAAGRLLTSSDQAERTVTYAYDGRGRPTLTTYADGTTEETVYATGADANLVAKRKDRNDIWEEFGYDHAGRQTSAVLNRGQPDQVVRTWTFVPGKNDVASETVNGRTTAYQYDEHGRVSQVTTWSTPTVAHASANEVWDAQRVTVSTDDRGCHVFALEALDGLRSRTVREVIPDALAAIAGADAGDQAQRTQALWNLSRPGGNNPAYTIEETLRDVAGQVVSRIDAAGVTSSTAFDNQGRATVTSIVDRVSGQTVQTQVAYDPQGNRTLVTAPRSFAPDAPGTFATTFSYTGRNLVASQTEQFVPKAGSSLPAITATTNFTYTPTGQKQTESSPRNPDWLTTFTYATCCDRLESVADPLGFTTRYGYDNLGRVTATTDANRHATGSLFDAQGRVTSRSDGNGKVTTTVYDDDLTDGAGLDARFPAYVADLGFGPGAVGSAELSTAPTGDFSLVIHDGLGRVLRQVTGSATPEVMTYRYDLPPVDGLEVVQVADSQGNVTTQYRDGAGHIVRVALPGGATTAVSYDSQGNAVAQTDANGVTSRTGYDDLGRPVLVTDGGGSTVRRAYDEQGNVISETDAMGATITRVYDGLNRKISETDRLGHTTTFTYNLAGGLESITDAEGGVTQYAYDARNSLVSESFPGSSGGTRGSTFDAAGLMQTHTDQRGIITTLGYDAANRLQTRTYSTGAVDSFTYDDAGRLLTAVSGRYHTTITRTYQDGLLHSETQQRPDGSATLTWAYDDLRRPVRIDLDDGTSVGTAWSDRGQVTGGTIDAVSVFTRAYDDGGRILDTRFANGLTEHRTYTPANQVRDLTVTAAPTASAKLVDITYAYDDNRRKTSEQDRRQSGEAQSFGYDLEDRLTSWTRSPGRIGAEAPPPADAQSWKLSPVGDWRETTVNGTTQTRGHSPVHEVTTVDAVPLSYDANGNLTRDHHGRLATWDEDNRLATVQVHDAAENVSSTAIMCYDALGRRLSRTAFGRTTVFVLNNTQVIQERDIPQALAPTDVASDGAKPADGAPAPEGSILDQPGAWHINCQPVAAPMPEGWMADKGRALAERTNGLTYGWEVAGTPAALDEANSVSHGVMPQPELDTAHILTAADSAAVWRCALPNGHYAVVVVAGDPASHQHTNNFTLNGQSLADPDPYDPAANRGYNLGDYDGWAVDVTVTDGYLSLVAGVGAFDPELCFVEVGPPGSAVDEALRQKLAGIIERATNRTAGERFNRPATPRTYAYGGDYIDAPLAMKIGRDTSAQTYFVHVNDLYSPQAVTNEAGQVIERYSYTAFGERTVLGGSSSTTSRIGFNHGFTGLRDECGLLFARNRYFSPELGRWTSRDPAGYVNGYGLYAGYFAPTSVDPEGLAAQCAEDAGEDIDPEGLAGLMEFEDASENGLFDPQPSVMQSALVAYRYMGLGQNDAWAMASDWQDMAAYTGDDAHSPMYFLNDAFDNDRDIAANNFGIAQRTRLARQYQVDAAMDMAFDEIDKVSTALEVISVAGTAFRAVSAFSKIAKAEKAMATFAKQAEMLSGLAKARSLTSISGKLRALTNAGFARTTAGRMIRDGRVCFVAGTQIPIEDGKTKAIELIEPGDMVLARDGDSGAEGYKSVVRTFVTQSDELVHLSFGEVEATTEIPSEIVATPGHPIWRLPDGWVPVGSLRVGDSVCCASGQIVRLKKSWTEHASEGHSFTTFNFEVSDWHTYFVQVGDKAVWVHNSCSWGQLVRKSKGGPPSGMSNPHGHHMLRQNPIYRSVDSQRMWNIEGRLLSRAGMTRNSMSNLTWAPMRGMHGLAAQRKALGIVLREVRSGKSLPEALGVLENLILTGKF